MARWFTADLHLGHENIIRYSNRPFADAEAMNRALVERWNETVDPSDEVWVLGDVALGRIAETLPLVSTLHGHKRLIAGNHDRCWEGHGRRAEGWDERYIDAGFAEIHHGQLDVTVGDVAAVACHFPYEGDSQESDRMVAHRPADEGRWLLHGHVHDRWLQWDRMINVGVDAWRFRPVSEAEVYKLIVKGPQTRPCPVERPGAI
ncbi:MAG: hypothetical protein ACRD0A_14590 [Acidimicrobiales bacterium]